MHQVGGAEDNDDMSSLKSIGSLGLLVSLIACSPALDWRSVRIDDMALQASLPCKPERANRKVSWAGHSVDMSLVGCEARGAMWTISSLALPADMSVGEGLAQWRQITLAHLRSETGAATQPFVPPGALEVPQSARQHVQGQSPGGGALLEVDLAWFARVSSAGTLLYQTAIYAPSRDADGAETWLAGLHFE